MTYLLIDDNKYIITDSNDYNMVKGLSSDYYAKYYDKMKYENACVIVIEALENYTNDLKKIKNEYYNNNLEKAYKAVIER